MEDKPEKTSAPVPGRSARRALQQEILRAVVVDNVQRFVGWAIAAILPLPFAVVKFAAHQHSAAVVAAGISLICLVPPAVGVARSRLWRRTRKAETERDTLREENVELVAATNQATRSSKMLADWLNDTLVDPYRRRNVDPNRDFETWLNDIVIKVMRVVFPEQGAVGLAIISEHAETYAITHRSGGLPESILRVDPAPIHRPLAECISRHVAHARLWSFQAGGDRAWVAFFPERAFDEAIHESQLASIAATVVHVYAKQGLAAAAS